MIRPPSGENPASTPGARSRWMVQKPAGGGRATSDVETIRPTAESSTSARVEASVRPGERIAAVVLPTVAFTIGAAVPRSRLARAAIKFLTLLTASIGLLIVIASRRTSARPGSIEAPHRRPDPSPRVTVLIPARDEAAVIGGLIADLAAQDLRCDEVTRHCDVIVIDDRSTDGTGAVAQQAGRTFGLEGTMQVVRRSAGADGKGAALAAAPRDGSPDDIIVVLDADARIEPGFLRQAIGYLERGDVAVTARRRMMVPGDGSHRSFARIQDDEQAVDRAIQRARDILGRDSEFRGNGMILRRRDLVAAGGWDPAALCEDLELSTRLTIAHGRGPAAPVDLEVWEQPVTSLTALVRQRLRWAEGAVRRDLRITGPAIVAGRLPTHRRVAMAAYGMQSLVPFVALGMVGRARSSAARRHLASLTVAYAAAGWVVALDGLRAASDGEPASMAVGRSSRWLDLGIRAAHVLALSSIWPILMPVAWLRVIGARGPLRFSKTRHVAGFSRPNAVGDGARTVGH